MKVIFLDFDGVLNTQEYRNIHGSSSAGIDKSKLPLLKKLVDCTGAKIVLTTSLRTYWDKDPGRCDYYGKIINETFADYGLEVYDKTPVLENSKREDEILQWIVDNPGIKNYVAIDDGFLSANFLLGRFVQTSDTDGGLEEKHIDKAIEILGNI